jgi:hypothetical protein
MIQFAEWMFWIANGFGDDFHHSFHNATLVAEFCRASPSLSATAAACTPDYQTDQGARHSNLPTEFYLV